MQDAKLVVVETYTSTMEAEMDKGRLETAGIDAMIQADDCGGMRPHLQLKGVQLLVRDTDLEEAREILVFQEDMD